MNARICKLCNEEFIPKSPRQMYCKRPIEKICPVCGDMFTIYCQPDNPTTCSKPECKKKAGYIGSIDVERVCKICGSKFKPTSSTQQYCNKIITRTCKVCGREFTIQCTAEQYKKQTCSEECMQKLASEHRQDSYMKETKICELCGKEFHPRSNTQKVCEGKHFRNCCVCGREFELEYKSSIGQADLRKTCSDECFRKLNEGKNPFANPESLQKYKEACLAKYGVDHPMKSAEIKSRIFASYKDRTGYDHPSHNPDTLKGIKLNISSLEERFKNVLCNNQIEFIQQKQVSKGDIHHKFDFYLPKYKMYIDIDGMYYHGYLDDSNGWQVDEDRDNKRMMLITDEEIYVVIPEIGMNRAIDQFLSDIKAIDNNAFNYEEYMFNWCRSIKFPYPEYKEDRLNRDYKNLCKYDCADKYNPHAKLGLSTIRHFHKSIYDARVGNNPSIKDAWYDDNILKKVIHNRMIYRNDADPSKILTGFYISKVVPKVSIFNPVLARYLTLKYLSEFDKVVDPFSGFSGRLLGVAAAGKEYRGSDINPIAVKEANEIIQFHKLKGKVECRDVLKLDSEINADCLLTCPPYGTKERYSIEHEFKTCDEWIDCILSKYKCKRYVFVVDHSEKYNEYIAEEIVTPSYFKNIVEHIVVI